MLFQSHLHNPVGGFIQLRLAVVRAGLLPLFYTVAVDRFQAVGKGLLRNLYVVHSNPGKNILGNFPPAPLATKNPIRQGRIGFGISHFVRWSSQAKSQSLYYVRFDTAKV